MTVTVKPPTSGEIKGNGDSENATPPFKCFAFQDPAEQAWWDKTAALLTKILQSAQYSVENQYLYMMLYRSVLIPRLGPHPHTWDSFITYSGVPVEFSINLQEHGPPTARIGWEPVSHKSGSPADPINQATITEAIATISELNLKGFNSQYLNHMVKSLTATSEESAEVDRDQLYLLRMKNQVSFGLDLKGGEVSVKCYLYPALKSHLTGRTFKELLNHAVHSLGEVCYPGLDTVHEYLESAGFYNQYSFIGIDCTAVAKSRLKVYNTIQDVTWSKLQDIWTLGGRFKSHATTQRGLQFAQKFWQLVTLDQVSDSSLSSAIISCFYLLWGLRTKWLLAFGVTSSLPDPAISLIRSTISFCTVSMTWKMLRLLSSFTSMSDGMTWLQHSSIRLKVTCSCLLIAPGCSSMLTIQ